MYVSTKIVGVNVTRGKVREFFDNIALETILKIYVNESYYGAFLLTPDMLKEFVIGNLFSEGVIDSLKDIQKIEISKDIARVESTRIVSELLKAKRNLVEFSCVAGDIGELAAIIGRYRVSSDIMLNASTIVEVFRTLHERMPVFRATGCTHGAALLDERGEIDCLAEDLGRHNAVDKVAGFALLRGLNLNRYALILTGRETPQIVLKAARIGTPIVCSFSAPTLGAIKLAKALGLTLVGFVRGGRFNVYSHPERIRIDFTSRQSL
ncbi:MAG: formate dehydrogenase accessory sulfurtransferase FdhD [Thermoprotei archaeon]|nr:MAG: formate dehydrogenase accessory sulfurtransferase FdhD [Thermoprotei archaeon]